MTTRRVAAPSSLFARLAGLAAGLVAVMGAPSAWAQGVYRCSTGSGAYISDRPCAGSVSRTELRSFGAAPERPAYNPYSQGQETSMSKAPEILPYLSVECAQMNDAVRTGPARGLKGASYSELVVNYRRRCGEDEQVAYQKMSQDRADERNRRQSDQREQSAEKARARLSVEQCDEMLRILAGKRRRTASMTAGEQRDLEAFEANYQARCKAG